VIPGAVEDGFASDCLRDFEQRGKGLEEISGERRWRPDALDRLIPRRNRCISQAIGMCGLPPQ
jgi:hypothetical protein